MAIVITLLILAALIVLVAAMCKAAGRADEESERAYQDFLARQGKTSGPVEPRREGVRVVRGD